MFESLTDRFDGILSRLRGRGRLSEADVDEVLREIRTALLEADVEIGVVRKFTTAVRDRCVGLELSQSLSPGQQVIKIVNEELVAILGGETLQIRYASRPPTVILLAGQHPQLLDGGGTLEVGTHQERVAALLFEPAGQLGRCRGLARALESGQQDDRRGSAGVPDLEGLPPEDGDQFLVDDLDDLLARAQALGEFEPQAAVAHRRGELADHADLDVGLEEGGADLAEDLVDIGLGQPSSAPESAEDAVESVGQALEHGVLSLPDRTGTVVRPVAGPGPVQKSASTKAWGSKSIRSSGPSPSPTSLTGRPSSRWMATTMPPLAVPSSLVRTTPDTSTASRNTLAWARPFWPVVASSTSSTSVTRPGGRSDTRRIFFSSSIRLTLLCSRPAVSASTSACPLEAARCTASKTTELGSPPSDPRTMSAPADGEVAR